MLNLNTLNEQKSLNSSTMRSLPQENNMRKLDISKTSIINANNNDNRHSLFKNNDPSHLSTSAHFYSSKLSQSHRVYDS